MKVFLTIPRGTVQVCDLFPVRRPTRRALSAGMPCQFSQILRFKVNDVNGPVKHRIICLWGRCGDKDNLLPIRRPTRLTDVEIPRCQSLRFVRIDILIRPLFRQTKEQFRFVVQRFNVNNPQVLLLEVIYPHDHPVIPGFLPLLFNRAILLILQKRNLFSVK